MTRHLLDRSKPRTHGARLFRFLNLERQMVPNQASKTLQRRTPSQRSGPMLAQFLRMDRDARR